MESARQSILRELRSKNSKILITRLERPALPPTKSAEESAILVKKADFLYNRDKHGGLMHVSICTYSTRGLGYAPPGSESQAKAYAERSRILLHIGKYRDCLDDCQRGLSIPACPDIFAIMMHCRQLECKLALGLGGAKEDFAAMEARYKAFREAATYPENKQLRAVARSAEQAFLGASFIQGKCKPDSADDDVPVTRVSVELTHEAVRVVHDGHRGHLQAARDIHAGEIVLVEECYATSMARGVQGHSCCRYCLRFSWSTLPCDHCFNYFYCSERCKNQAWSEYHEIECELMHKLFGEPMYADVEITVVLALRVMLKGLKEAGSIAKLREIVNEVDNNEDLETRGMTDGDFCANFKAFYSLTAPAVYDPQSYVTMTVALYTVAFAKHTKIFGPDFSFDSCSDLARDHDVVFIGALFLKLTKMCATYRKLFDVASVELMEDEGTIIFHKVDNKITGAGLAPHASLITHSCCPNVIQQYTHDGKIIYYSTLPIPKDTRITQCLYLPFYSTATKAERQRYLFEMEGLICTCDACTYDWGSKPPQDDNRVEHFDLNPADFAHVEIAGPRIADLVSYLPALKSHNIELLATVREFLGRAIEELVVYPFPNPVTLALFYAMRIAFERTYGHVPVDMPDKCNAGRIA